MKNITKIITDHLNEIGLMSVKEFTLYKKWSQLNTQEYKNFYNKNINLIHQVKNDIWVPKNLEDYKDLNIDILITGEDKKLNLIWRILRDNISVAPWTGTPGRILKGIVVNKRETKNPFFGQTETKYEYLGVISLGSDFISMKGRDKIIGWTMDQKMSGKLNYIAMGSSIVPTQPFGYLYTGGKLITYAICSDVVESAWNKQYPNENLVGITTTSLYGGYSQYNGLKYWKKCESTVGNIPIEPTEDVYDMVRDWLKNNHGQEYDKIFSEKTDAGNPKSHPKARVMALLHKKMKGLPKVKSGAPRGVYWCSLFENTERFLSDQDKKLGNKKFDNQLQSLVDLWKTKYAKKRLDNLQKNDRINTDSLFLEEFVNGDWEYIKNKYLKEE